MKKHWFCMVFTACVLVLFIYLPFSSRIFSAFSEHCPERIELGELCVEEGFTSAGNVANIIITNSVTGIDMTLTGWAFLPITTGEPSQREIKLLFVSDLAAYSWDITNLTLRQDVFDQYVSGNEELYSNFMGFSSRTVNLAGMKDATYNIAIYIAENETDRDIIFTENYIKKEKGAAAPYYGEQVDNIEQYEQNVSLQHGLLATWDPEMTGRSDTVLIGYLYLPGQPTEGQKVYAQVKDATGNVKTYQANSYHNKEVARTSGDRNTLNAGFTAYLPADVSGEVEVVFLLETADAQIYAIDTPYKMEL